MNDALNDTIDTGYQRPRDPVEIWLARQWQHILGFAVGIRENFFSVGGNSLDVARVIDAILVEFGIQLPMNVLTDYPTVERLATLLRGHDGRLSGPLVAIQDGDGSRPPLFLVHPDDGQVGPYCQLAYALGEEFTVFGLQAAGLYSDAEPRRTVPAMADSYVEAIRAERASGPYLLGGCAIGAAIAYEMAVRLDDVRLLAAIDTELLEPPDTGTESWSQAPPRQSDLPRILAELAGARPGPGERGARVRRALAGRVAGQPRRRARLAAIAVHRAGRRLRPAADHYVPAADRDPADTRVRR